MSVDVFALSVVAVEGVSCFEGELFCYADVAHGSDFGKGMFF